MDLNPVEQLAHSTVRIECDLISGGLCTGTGFFYSLDCQGDQHIPVVITNKHVIEGTSKGSFVLTLQDSSGAPDVGKKHRFELSNFQSLWIPHPDNAVDLCAMPLVPLLKLAEQQGKKFFFVTFNKSLLPTAVDLEEMLGMEEITMVGYPNGLWDSVNNLPIFPRGVLASDLKRDWNGKMEFLIDAACFPGSSGSPVLLLNMGSYQTKAGRVIGASRIKLLGILYAGPQHTVEGEVQIVAVPTQQKAISISSIPNNLGVVIKSQRLLDFENIFK